MAKKKATSRKKVSPIPKGYHTITPGLAVRNAAEALDFYKKAFGAKEKMRMPGPDGKIMHAEIQIGDSHVTVGEEMPQMGHPSPQTINGSPVNLYIYVKNVDKAFDQAVKAGATVVMPVTDMFWGDRHGALQDPFGHRWGIATRKRNLSAKEMQKAADEWFAQQAKQL
ncbi:MAG TPA: VOC family protein [Nitrososphaera sp.]